MLKSLETKIPPPVVALVVAVAMWGIANATVDGGPAAGLRLPLAGFLAAVGAAFDLSALFAFHRARTTVNPMKPGKTTSIVQSGVYQVTRNPMYVGLACFLCAWAAYLWSGWSLVGPVAFVAYISRFQIRPEEETLTRLFGPEYETYQAKVRRWL